MTEQFSQLPDTGLLFEKLILPTCELTQGNRDIHCHTYTYITGTLMPVIEIYVLHVYQNKCYRITHKIYVSIDHISHLIIAIVRPSGTS